MVNEQASASANRSDDSVITGPDLPSIYRGSTLAHRLGQAAAEFPDVPLVFWQEAETSKATLGELDKQGNQLAAALYAMGLRPGDGIAIQMPNQVESAVAYRACFALGAVLTPVVPIYGAKELGFILRQSRAKILFVPDRWRNVDFMARLRELGDCPDLEHVVVLGESDVDGTISWDRLMRSSHPGFKSPRIAPDDPALLLYTSGTTADPKGVLHSSASLLAELDQRVCNGEGRDSVVLSALPSGHIAGFGNLVFPQLIGGRSILMDRWSAEDAVRLMADHKVTRSSGVPLYLNDLLDAAKTLGADLSALSSYMIGAASVPPALVERASGAGVAVYKSYGSSEHPTVSAGHPTDDLHFRAFTDGPVLPGVEVRILDEKDRDVAGLTEGEIVTRGPELFAGYKDEALNAAAFIEGGWFRTGDIGRVENGRLTITDRKKDIIIRGGEKISSKEVEDILSRHPSVMEAAAFGVEHARLGETVAVAVVLRDGETFDSDSLSKHFSEAGVASAKTPERLIVLDEFPRTPTGKIQKFELKSSFAKIAP